MYDPSALEEDLLSATLGTIPVPAGSPDFDERVLRDVRSPGEPWWRRLAAPMRPALAGAACAVPLMLVLINWSIETPSPASPLRPVARTELTDKVMDQPYLTASALWWFTLVVPNSQPSKGPLSPRSDSPASQTNLPGNAFSQS